MSSSADHYLAASTALLQEACARNAPVLQQLGAVIGASVAAGGVLHLFGSGHSEIVARELIGRAGGLVCVNGISDPTGGFVENVAGYGTALAGRYDRRYQLRPGETLIVVSNSGKNASPLEVALYAKQQGLTVAALTCVAMAAAATSAHPGGRTLPGIADYVLDNGGVPGDALTPVADGVRAGPTSTLVGAMLLNLLMLEVIDWLKAGGHPLPILRSQNLPGAIEYNRRLAAKYQGRLSRQLA